MEVHLWPGVKKTMSLIFNSIICFGSKNNTNVPYEFQFMSECSLNLFRFSASYCLTITAEICDSDERDPLGSTALVKRCWHWWEITLVFTWILISEGSSKGAELLEKEDSLSSSTNRQVLGLFCQILFRTKVEFPHYSINILISNIDESSSGVGVTLQFGFNRDN